MDHQPIAVVGEFSSAKGRTFIIEAIVAGDTINGKKTDSRYRIEKSGSGSLLFTRIDPPGESYTVATDAHGIHHCECWAGLRWRNCKHLGIVAGLRDAISGKESFVL